MGGKVIRRVPPNWEHPRDGEGDYLRLYDETYEDEIRKWIAGRELWLKGEHPEQQKLPDRPARNEWIDECPQDDYGYADHEGGPPDTDSYRPSFKEEPTWYQMYEEISEGTPLSPPFATKEELVDYLVEHGDFGYQRWPEWETTYKPTRAQAKAFVEQGWAPSMVVRNTPEELTIKHGLQTFEEEK